MVNTEEKVSNLGVELIEVYKYIEKVRSYGVNINGRRRLPREKNADLYFAGRFIIDIVRECGTSKDNEFLQREIDNFEKSFKS